MVRRVYKKKVENLKTFCINRMTMTTYCRSSNPRMSLVTLRIPIITPIIATFQRTADKSMLTIVLFWESPPNISKITIPKLRIGPITDVRKREI